MNKDILESIATAGVVGAGGAGFPTHVKLAAVADTVVINAAECEPLLHKDKELIVHRTSSLVDGLDAAIRITNAKRGVVGIKAKYKNVIETLRPKLSRSMEIIPLDDAYPAGDEITLIYETLGRIVAPGAIPITVGAVVMNVETAVNLAGAVGDGTAVMEKYVSVAGNVSHPCTVCVPIGSPLSVCIAAAGGVTIDKPAYVVGGAMMGYVETDLTKPVTKTTGGIIVLPHDHFVVQRKLWNIDKTKRVGRAACDQCSFCTELCPRYLLGHPIEPHRAMRSLGFSSSRQSDTMGTAFCCECNLCSYCSCPEGLDPKNVCLDNKRRLIAEKKRYENPPFNKDRAANHHKNRKTPTSRLIHKIGLSSYTNKAPLEQNRIVVNEVLIPLKQHIGATCQCCVKVGDKVSRGQAIGTRPITDNKPALGANIHASIDGTVVEIADYVKIIAS